METSEELARKRIYLTDTDGGSEEIEILIGADQYEKLMTGQRYKLRCGLVAAESVFGWTLCGELNQGQSTFAATVISTMTCEERSLPQLWNLETIGIKHTQSRFPRRNVISK